MTAASRARPGGFARQMSLAYQYSAPKLLPPTGRPSLAPATHLRSRYISPSIICSHDGAYIYIYIYIRSRYFSPSVHPFSAAPSRLPLTCLPRPSPPFTRISLILARCLHDIDVDIKGKRPENEASKTEKPKSWLQGKGLSILITIKIIGGREGEGEGEGEEEGNRETKREGESDSWRVKRGRGTERERASERERERERESLATWRKALHITVSRSWIPRSFIACHIPVTSPSCPSSHPVTSHSHFFVVCHIPTSCPLFVHIPSSRSFIAGHIPSDPNTSNRLLLAASLGHIPRSHPSVTSLGHIPRSHPSVAPPQSCPDRAGSGTR